MRTLSALVSNSAFADAQVATRLRILLEEFAGQLRAAGYPISAYRGDFADNKLVSLPKEKLEGIYSSFAIFYDVCATTIESGDAEDRTMAWNMLLRMKLKPLSDVFGHIRDGDIIEIYNQDSVQVFRSFSFFHLVSYTLAELFGNEWWELYSRPEQANLQMMALGEKILKSELRETVLAGVAPHVVQEVFSEGRKKASITEVLLSPLMTADKSAGGFIHVFRVKNL
jgi:hypothetical protein